MKQNDTIAAIATPAGKGGIGIVRLSGNLALDIAKKVIKIDLIPRYAGYATFLDEIGEPIDEGIVLFFKAPHSFTGEDVVEFHGHGSPVVQDRLLRTFFRLGARPARPGEFSERAFLNDKLDLVQAEAIADLIESVSERASKMALRNLKGAFSKKIEGFQEALAALRVYVEAAIDFPEEEIDFLNDGKIFKALCERIDELELLLKQSQLGALLKEGLTVVLAGYPNAGKSTLLNALSGKESAIVTDIPGTTRDIIREHILIDGMPVYIIDTAGLRESQDVVEQEGIRRAWKEIQEADLILLLIEVDEVKELERIQEDLLKKINKNVPCWVIVNKVDKLSEIERKALEGKYDCISAKYGTGIETLQKKLSHQAGLDVFSEESGFMARRRHIEALEQALFCLRTGKEQLTQHKAGELLAEDLRQAQKYLSEITGEFSSDDLLGKIFSSFCIGK